MNTWLPGGPGPLRLREDRMCAVMHNIDAQRMPVAAARDVRAKVHPTARLFLRALTTGRKAMPLLDLENLQREVERAIRRDAPRREASGAITLGARDDDLARLTELHPKQTLVPALDHLPHARQVGEWLLSWVLGAPELLSGLLHHACSVNGDIGTLADGGPLALLQDGVHGSVTSRSWRGHRDDDR